MTTLLDFNQLWIQCNTFYSVTFAFEVWLFDLVQSLLNNLWGGTDLIKKKLFTWSLYKVLTKLCQYILTQNYTPTSPLLSFMHVHWGPFKSHKMQAEGKWAWHGIMSGDNCMDIRSQTWVWIWDLLICLMILFRSAIWAIVTQ